MRELSKHIKKLKTTAIKIQTTRLTIEKYIDVFEY